MASLEPASLPYSFSIPFALQMVEDKCLLFKTVHNPLVNNPTLHFKNGVFQNSCLGCLHVHSSTTPNWVFLKPPFEGVTGHPQNTLPSGSESLKAVLCKNCIYTLLILKCISLRVILKFMKYLTIPNTVAKQKRNQHNYNTMLL